MQRDLDELQREIGYRFTDADRLVHALTHRSFASEAGRPGRHNERLEFLGDAVLGLAAARRLYERFPDCAEGRLSKIKAGLVSAAALHGVARRIGLGRFLQLGGAEEGSGGREKKGLLVDALEALIAAVYLDGGLAAAERLIDRLILSPKAIEGVESNLATDNAKSTLQEILQGKGEPLPVYRVVEEIGPPHQRRFRVELTVNDCFRTAGEGSTKREAEQRAALEALDRRDEWLFEKATGEPVST